MTESTASLPPSAAPLAALRAVSGVEWCAQVRLLGRGAEVRLLGRGAQVLGRATDTPDGAAGGDAGIAGGDVGVVDAIGPQRPVPIASVGKLLLLVEVARRFAVGDLDPDEPLRRDAAAPVHDSGLWQHLEVDRLRAADCAALVAAVSDNLATNVLLARVGLEQVAATAARIGLEVTALHDRVRDVRGPGDPVRLATGTAHELCRLVAALHVDGQGSPPLDRHLGVPGVAARVHGWLRLGVDTSMVAGGTGVDPLAHVGADRGLEVASKSGTDRGVRADVGCVHGSAGTLAYAVLATWEVDGPPRRDAVLEAMRHVGRQLGDAVRPSRGA